MNTTSYFDIYEAHVLYDRIVTLEEASTNTITIPDIEAHAIAIADAKYARAYGELSATEREEALVSVLEFGKPFAPIGAPFGALSQCELEHEYYKLCHPISEITNIAYTAPDTIVTFPHIAEGERIDMFIPISSAPPMPDVQFGISYNPDAYYEEVDVESCSGDISMQSPIGNNDLRKFLATFADNGNDAIWNKIWVLDIISPLEHSIFHEVDIVKYGQTSRGEMTIGFAFTFP